MVNESAQGRVERVTRLSKFGDASLALKAIRDPDLCPPGVRTAVMIEVIRNLPDGVGIDPDRARLWGALAQSLGTPDEFVVRVSEGALPGTILNWQQAMARFTWAYGLSPQETATLTTAYEAQLASDTEDPHPPADNRGLPPGLVL